MKLLVLTGELLTALAIAAAAAGVMRIVHLGAP
jgi:hypothetical protein